MTAGQRFERARIVISAWHHATAHIDFDRFRLVLAGVHRALQRASNIEEVRAALVQQTTNPAYHPDVDQFMENLIAEISVVDQMIEDVRQGEQP